MEKFILVCAGFNFGMAAMNFFDPTMHFIVVLANAATGILCLIPEKFINIK